MESPRTGASHSRFRPPVHANGKHLAPTPDCDVRPTGDLATAFLLNPGFPGEDPC
jgi:hypothetical protein